MKIDYEKANEKFDDFMKIPPASAGKKSRLNPESDQFDSCYYSDSEDEDLEEVLSDFESAQEESALTGLKSVYSTETSSPLTCTVNTAVMEKALADPDSARKYLNQDKIVLNWAEAERAKENKTVVKRKCREERHRGCVSEDVVEEANQPKDPNKTLTPYEAM